MLAYAASRTNSFENAHPMSTFLRIVVWSVYLTADWVASVALGNLAASMQSADSDLQEFWAPFLLLHLGGPDTITAYSLEDKELSSSAKQFKNSLLSNLDPGPNFVHMEKIEERQEQLRQERREEQRQSLDLQKFVDDVMFTVLSLRFVPDWQLR
ncbi:hypothetical protein Ddye_011814 [Dipteronia dyeriana]|uniref:DUF4220 domain-containing protein n=1 Tax=Dipteronia dyeriana TaxID=168575 RepID=A0AAE0CIN5_9ROSI|nr:hypothetical protein Ddye_011814 [Dipteronia dyeriana]